MSDFKADNFQVGSIQKAISENLDSELIFRDANYPQGITLSNMVTDVSFAQQIQENVTAQVENEIANATTAIQENVIGLTVDNKTLIDSMSGSLYDGTYSSYLESEGIFDTYVRDTLVNNFKQNVGVNTTPLTQFHVKNKEGVDLTTVITLENRYPDVVGAPTAYYNYTSNVTQFGKKLILENTTPDGTVELTVQNNDLLALGYEGNLSVNDLETVTNNTLLLQNSPISGSTLVETTTGGSAVVTSVGGGITFDRTKVGSKIVIGGQDRLVSKVVSDTEIEVLSISGQGSDAVNAYGGASYYVVNPLLETKENVITPYEYLGLGTKAPTTRLHIKGEEAIFLEDTDPKILFGNKEDTYGVIEYNYTSDPISTQGFSLQLGSKKLGQGASVRISSVSNLAQMNSTPSGEIEFYTSPYSYEESLPEVRRGVFNTYGNFGVGVNEPLSKLHIKEGEYVELTGTASVTGGSMTIVGSAENDQDEHETEFHRQVSVGDTIVFSGQERIVTDVSQYSITVNSPFTSGGAHQEVYVKPSLVRFDNHEGNVFKIDHDGTVSAQVVNTQGFSNMGDFYTNGSVGFFGTDPVELQDSLTPSVSITGSPLNETVIYNLVQRVQELEDTLKSYGLLPTS